MSNSNPAIPIITMTTNNNSNPSSNPTTNQANTNTSTTTNNPSQQKDGQQQQQQSQEQQQQQQQQQQSSTLIELESQFILRMPVIKQENGVTKPHPATLALREALGDQLKITDEQSDPLKGRLFIEINPETRKGRVRFDDDVFDARLVDLPCIVESLKTKDKKMFYKTADICQMLVCKTREDEWSDDDTTAEMEKAKKKGEVVSHAELLNRKYQWPHGITPPLKNVRRKRFRKVAKKRVIDYAEIEREVKQLFRADRDAANIAYEVVYMEGEGPTASNEGGGDNEGGLDNEEDANDRKTTTHKYDWDEDESMLSPDENSSSFMVRRTTGGVGLNKKSGAGPSSSSTNKEMKIKKEGDQSTTLDNILMDESSSKATAQSGGGGDQKQDTNMSSQQLDRSTLMDERTKNYEDLTNDDEASNLESTSNFKNLFVKEVLGDLSSSEEEDEDEDEEDQNDDEEKANQSDDSNSNMESVASKSKSNYNDEEENAAEEMEDDENTMDDDENTNAGFSADEKSSKSDELNSKLSKLYAELHRIQEERAKREAEINHISNPGLKVRLSSHLNNLIDSENKKKNEIEEIKSMIEDQ